MSDAPIGHNGGPRIEKFTAKNKIDRIRDLLEMDITATQKCVGIGIVVEADTDGIAAEISTKRLQTFASVSDRETVYRATKVLEEEAVAKAIKVKGKPNSYRVLPLKVIDAIVEAYNQTKVDIAEASSGSPLKPDIGSPSEPDGMEHEHPVGFQRTTPVSPVGSGLTGRVSPDVPSRADNESILEVNNKQKQLTTTTVETDAAREDGGGGFNFDVLNGTAVELTAFISKHAYVDAREARNMLANNVRTFGADAMMEAFSVIVAKMPDSVIARPYPFLIETARRIKTSATARGARGRDGDAPAETKTERRRQLVAATMEKLNKEGRPS